MINIMAAVVVAAHVMPPPLAAAAAVSITFYSHQSNNFQVMPCANSNNLKASEVLINNRFFFSFLCFAEQIILICINNRTNILCELSSPHFLFIIRKYITKLVKMLNKYSTV